MTTKQTTQLKNFSRINGLGYINFSNKLIENIIKTVIKEHSNFSYKKHKISNLTSNYYNVSIELLCCLKKINFKEIEVMQKELLLILKQSLRMSCALFINVKHE